MASTIGESIKFLKVKKCKFAREGLLTKFKLITDEGKILYYLDLREEKLLLNGLVPIECMKINFYNPMDPPSYVINKWGLNKQLSWKADWVNSDWGRDNEKNKKKR